MNQFKKAIMILSAGLLIPALSLSAQPQGDDGPGMRKHHGKHHKHRRKHMRKLMKKLDLTWKQRRQARDIRRDCRAKSKSERQAMRSTRGEIRELFKNDQADTAKVSALLNRMKPGKVKLGVLRMECRQKFYAMLTPEQQKRFQQFRAEHRGKKEARKAERKAKWKQKRERRMERMRKHLGLTDDQVARIKAVREKNAPARKEFRAKMKPLREQAFGLITSTTFDKSRAQSLVEQIVDLRTQKHLKRLEGRNEIRKILTPEQRKKMREFHKKRRKG